MDDHNEHTEHLDAATAKRLTQLGQRPVDTAALENRLQAALAPPPPTARTDGRRWLSPIAAMAAAVMLAAGLLFTVLQNDSSAAVLELSQLHHDLITKHLATPVQNVAEANAWIAQQEVAGPALPGDMSEVRVQSCCLADVQGDLVAVVVMQYQRTLVTLVVADAQQFAHRMGRAIERDERELFSHQVNGVQMVMANHDDRWLCVMGDLSDDQLADLAAEIQFHPAAASDPPTDLESN
ncbi:MAG: hypothetical protein CMJ49_05025 [Planctomycetaceae bacterium]|nr:hypothetical protein [Planctomycetaceae bacterium]